MNEIIKVSPNRNKNLLKMKMKVKKEMKFQI